MPTVINCPHCSKKLGVPDHAAGKQVRCPQCQNVFSVPSAQAAAPPRAVAPVPPPLPPPRSGVTAEPPAPARPRRAPEPREDDEFEEERPRRRRPQPRDVAPLKFKLAVKSDPDKRFKGFFEATLTNEGLELKQGKKHDFLVPIGSRAEYDGKNLLVLEIDERDVTFNVVKFGTYQHRLTRDIAAYVNGDRGPLKPSKYKLEWYLLIPAVLPFGIAFLAVGAIPWALAFGLGAGCVGLAQQDKWPVPARLAAILGLTVLGYAVVVALLMAFAINPRFR